MTDLGTKNRISIGLIQAGKSGRCFSLAEIQLATNNFDDTLVLGMGGFGKVYKGFIDDGATIVAIKRLNAESKQGAEEFWTEVKMLSELRHIHLVALIGYCNAGQEMILVYEYMSHGTFADHLYQLSRKGSRSSISNLSWKQRLDICIGAARGLDYLHTGTSQGFIHRDVKTTNILLDEKWVAKVSDFGLSKGTTSHSMTHVSTTVKGTFGYLDPDYFFTRKLTKKSDVYAFGVVLLEALCGRPAVDTRLDEEQISLVLWAQRCIKHRNVGLIIDPTLSGQVSKRSLRYFVEVIDKCLRSSPNERPTMDEVVGSLKLASVSRGKGRIVQKFVQGISLLPHAIYHWLRERKDSKRGSSKDSRFESLPIKPLSISLQPFGGINHFSHAEIRAATNNFSEGLLIGRGSSSKVYKGRIDGENLLVAIKMLTSLPSRPGEKVTTENQVQSLPPHLHIVSLIAVCSNNEDGVLLVYEYMANGSLRDHLHPRDYDPIPWEKRLQICIGAAQGLQYLHAHKIIHTNITSSKILLDEEWVAKLTDFTRSKIVPTTIADQALTPMFSGNSGYVDPEYLSWGQATSKSDVYSFGVVLLEVVCPKKPVIPRLNEDGQMLLVPWFKSSIQRGTIDQVIHPFLIGKIAPECLREFIQISWRCVLNQGIQRPPIEVVLWNLQYALQLQEAWQERVKIGVELPAADPDSYNNIFSEDDEFLV